MDPRFLDISLFGFYALWTVGVGLLLGNALQAVRQAQRARSCRRRVR
jgi:hypothetical protein